MFSNESLLANPRKVRREKSPLSRSKDRLARLIEVAWSYNLGRRATSVPAELQ